MNIEVCKKCSNYPKNFQFYTDLTTFMVEKKVKLVGVNETGHCTGCYFYLTEKEYEMLYRFNKVTNRIFYNVVENKYIIKNFLNEKCPYKFEHEVIDE